MHCVAWERAHLRGFYRPVLAGDAAVTVDSCIYHSGGPEAWLSADCHLWKPKEWMPVHSHKERWEGGEGGTGAIRNYTGVKDRGSG